MQKRVQRTKASAAASAASSSSSGTATAGSGINALPWSRRSRIHLPFNTSGGQHLSGALVSTPHPRPLGSAHHERQPPARWSGCATRPAGAEASAARGSALAVATGSEACIYYSRPVQRQRQLASQGQFRRAVQGQRRPCTASGHHAAAGNRASRALDPESMGPGQAAARGGRVQDRAFPPQATHAVR